MIIPAHNINTKSPCGSDFILPRSSCRKWCGVLYFANRSVCGINTLPSRVK